MCLQNLTAALTKRFDEFFSVSPTVNEAILATHFHPMFKLRKIPQNLNDQDRKRIQNMRILAAEQEQIASSEEADAETHTFQHRMKTIN
ncbi:hypothetical protein PR048_013711 [Dryococelus australis]|uniref:Uncharacterized protein n=1 Tax=Dryococelus australis TaxID=614101 RepID=A0ABQ9HTS4_9NEOP|nr:hypothetical protein PR048_013711 [Dryococelus australis]